MSGIYPFLPTETIESTEGFLRCLGSDDYVMVFELDVTVDNEKTISLYQYFGFEIEGQKNMQ
jgi:hypothetical protein